MDIIGLYFPALVDGCIVSGCFENWVNNEYHWTILPGIHRWMHCVARCAMISGGVPSLWAMVVLGSFLLCGWFQTLNRSADSTYQVQLYVLADGV